MTIKLNHRASQGMFFPFLAKSFDSRGGMVGTPAAYSASQEIPHNLWNPKVFHRLQKSLPIFPILSKINPFQYNHPPPSQPIYSIYILILISHLSLVFQLISFPQVSPQNHICTYPGVADDVSALTSHLTLINIVIWCSNWRNYQTDFVCTLGFDEAQGPRVRPRHYSCASFCVMQWMFVQNTGCDYDKVVSYRYLTSLSAALTLRHDVTLCVCIARCVLVNYVYKQQNAVYVYFVYKPVSCMHWHM